MGKTSERVTRRERRRRGIRANLMGTPSRPRLAVRRSLKHCYAQVIDDVSGKTIVQASSRDKEFKSDGTGNCAAATVVGTLLAQRALAAGVKQACFDRAGFRYRGRVKALAEAARKAGLKL